MVSAERPQNACRTHPPPLRIGQAQPSRQMGPEYVVLGESVLIPQQQFLIYQSGDKREQARPL